MTEYTFYFESKYRRWPDVNFLKFQVPDGTEFILSEEWLIALQSKKKTPMQRLIFLKRNNYGNSYRVTVEVASAINRASGKIVLSRRTKPIRTSIIILLSDFQQFHYPVQDKIRIEEVEICQRILGDVFKYKISVIRLDSVQYESEVENIPERDKLLFLSDQLHSLLDTGDFFDIIITDGNSEIKAHRNILATRSVYFRCMFQNNWRENLENVILFQGTDMTVIKEILHYIYSGRIRTMEFSVMYDLFEAADKFLLDDLKELLSRELKKHLNMENAVGIYMLAHFASDENLKHSSLEVIRNHFDVVQNTEFWNCLRNERDFLDIVEDILHGLG